MVNALNTVTIEKEKEEKDVHALSLKYACRLQCSALPIGVTVDLLPSLQTIASYAFQQSTIFRGV